MGGVVVMADALVGLAIIVALLGAGFIVLVIIREASRPGW